MIKTAAEFEADAAKVYEAIRDEGKALAILHLAAALLEAYAEGSNDAFSLRTLAQTPPATDREM